MEGPQSLNAAEPHLQKPLDGRCPRHEAKFETGRRTGRLTVASFGSRPDGFSPHDMGCETTNKKTTCSVYFGNYKHLKKMACSRFFDIGIFFGFSILCTGNKGKCIKDSSSLNTN